jgi:AcrR family transcriptional regulator
VAEPRRSPGRPRDASISERALEATRDLLTERGFDATTMQSVAARAGVHASALYRRWPSRIEMIAEAAFPGLDPGSVSPSGELRRDLRRFVRAYTAAFTSPAARAAAPGLLAHNQSSPGPRPPELNLRVSARPAFRAILSAAGPGRVDPAVDPDDAFDMLLGAILVRILLPAATTRRQPMERIVDLAIRFLRPATGPGAAPAG